MQLIALITRMEKKGGNKGKHKIDFGGMKKLPFSLLEV